MTDRYINFALISSDNGSRAFAIMRAFRFKQLRAFVQVKALISTRRGAGCLRQAEICGIPSFCLDYDSLGKEDFSERLSGVIAEEQIQVIFAVGCETVLPPLSSVRVYVSQPAADASGNPKYFQRLFAADQSGRGEIIPRYLAYAIVREYGTGGQPLIKGYIEVPERIMGGLRRKEISVETAMESFRHDAVEYEQLMLPAAVNMAALKELFR